MNIESNQTLNGVLTLGSTTAILDADGSANTSVFTLTSTASGDARIAVVPAGAQITGNMTVQRYLPNNVTTGTKRRNRYLASPVSGATVAQWQALTPITGTFTGASTGTDPDSGTPLSPNLPSLLVYDESKGTAGKTYVEGLTGYPTSSNTDPLMNGTGYALFIRRGTNITPVQVTLSLRGVPKTGDLVKPLSYTTTSQGAANDGFNLIGNPYASPISWNSIAKPAGVDGTVYVRDMVQISGSSPGTYLTFNGITGTGDFTTGNIASGQGFFVKANTTGQSLTISESAKTTSATFYREQGPKDLVRVKINGTDGWDEAVVYFDERNTDSFDNAYDAYKLNNDFVNLGLFNPDSLQLTINALAKISDKGDFKKEVGISTELKNPGSYQLSFSDFENFNERVGITLVDNELGIRTNLKETKTYTFATATTNYNNKSRFKIVFESAKILANEPVVNSELRLYPNPVNGDIITLEAPSFNTGQAGVEIYDLRGVRVGGQRLSSAEKGIFPVNISTLSPGTYLLKIQDTTKVQVLKFIKQ